MSGLSLNYVRFIDDHRQELFQEFLCLKQLFEARIPQEDLWRRVADAVIRPFLKVLEIPLYFLNNVRQSRKVQAQIQDCNHMDFD